MVWFGIRNNGGKKQVQKEVLMCTFLRAEFETHFPIVTQDSRIVFLPLNCLSLVLRFI